MASELEEERTQAVDPARVPERRPVRHGQRHAPPSASRPPRRSSSRKHGAGPHACTRPRCSPGLPAGAVAVQPAPQPDRGARSAATRCSRRWPRTATSRRREAADAHRPSRSASSASTIFDKRREPYFFDYVQDKLIERYGVGVYRRGGLKVHTTIDPKMQELGRTRDQRPAQPARRPELGDRRDRPEDRLHPRDGVERHLQRPDVQPRRAGPPPARLGVQDDGARHRAAQGHRPELDGLRVEAAPAQRAGLRAVEGQDLRRQLRRRDEPRHARR